MSKKIPQGDGPFNSFINSSSDYLAEGTPTHASRLGLSVSESTEWDTRRVSWNTIYAKYNDTSKRTKTVTAEKETQKRAFMTFAYPLMTRMGVSPALTNDDRGALNLPERDAPTERGLITETCGYGCAARPMAIAPADMRMPTFWKCATNWWMPPRAKQCPTRIPCLRGQEARPPQSRVCLQLQRTVLRVR